MDGSKYIGTGAKASAADIAAAAASINIPAIRLRALLAVETSGKGFDPQRRPIILYEPHVLHRVVLPSTKGTSPAALDRQRQLKALTQGVLAYPAWGTRPYPAGQDAQYKRLDAAAAIVGQEAAVQACSWGLGQVLGENAIWLGYKSAVEFVKEQMTGEAAQLGAIIRFLRKKNLIEALRAGHYYDVARGWNGTGNAEAYSKLLTNAEAALVQASPGRNFVEEPGRVTANNQNAVLHPAKPPELTADDLNNNWALTHPNQTR